MSTRLQLTLACGDYDRTHALADGSVQPEGIELNFVPLRAGEIFWRMLRHEEFDASELSLSAYLLGLARGDTRFVGIPVFPLRMFRHEHFWVNTEAGIEKPEDLKGKRVGIPEYHMTALLFIRGMLKYDYGVLPEDITWLRSRVERVTLELPPTVRIEDVGPDRALGRMLEQGEVDAAAGTRPPRGLQRTSPHVRRLFVDARTTQLDYYRRTHIFPIMHVVAIRREIYERHRWVAQSLCKAFVEAKQHAYERMNEVNSLFSLPFLELDIEDERALFGDDPFPYGVEPNLPTLEAATLYSHEQGLSQRRVGIDELFAPEAIDVFADT